jgi:hypothetical protein
MKITKAARYAVVRKLATIALVGVALSCSASSSFARGYWDGVRHPASSWSAFASSHVRAAFAPSIILGVAF